MTIQNAPPGDVVNTPMVARMRLILALAVVVILLIDPHSLSRGMDISLTIPLGFIAYAVGSLALANRGQTTLILRLTHWADAAWVVALLAISGGITSIFFPMLFFAILEASFGWGFKESMRVVIATVVSFSGLALVDLIDQGNFELNWFLTRTVLLAGLGYMMGYWGEMEILFKRRLEILKEINTKLYGRGGIANMVAHPMTMLLKHYRADSVHLLLREDRKDAYISCAVGSLADEVSVNSFTREFDMPLTELPEPLAVVYSSRPRFYQVGPAMDCYFKDVIGTDRADLSREICEGISNFLEARSFLSVPIYSKERYLGRLFLTSGSRRFKNADIEFVQQFLEQLAVLIDNVNLVDELSSMAAENERQRISRDIHDSTIQPYIGLRLGLEALQRKVSANEAIARDIGDLVDMAGQTISDLRYFVSGLRGQGLMPGAELETALAKQADNYRRYYGIEVKVELGQGKNISKGIGERMGAEIFQIVCEGLSNIRRHTPAGSACITLVKSPSRIAVSIENPVVQDSRAEPGSAPQFVPRSISERARALGGTVEICRAKSGNTVVKVDLPIRTGPVRSGSVQLEPSRSSSGDTSP